MIILFGPAGSGKSTQGKLLAEKLGGEWLSVGEVLRADGRFERETKNGDLVENRVVVDLMAREIARIERTGKEVILDGYPRDLEQAEIMSADEKLVRFFAEFELALILEVPEEETRRRLAARGRADDGAAETIERRLKVYDENIRKIVPLLLARGVRVERVDGTGTVEEVFSRVEKVVKNNRGSDLTK